VKRSRELPGAEDRQLLWSITTHDVGCAALYPIPRTRPDRLPGRRRGVPGAGYGERLLKGAKACQSRYACGGFSGSPPARPLVPRTGIPCRRRVGSAQAARRSTTARRLRGVLREYNSRHGGMVKCVNSPRGRRAASRPTPGRSAAIWENVSKEAWSNGFKHQTMLVNETGLTSPIPRPASTDGADERHFFGEGAEVGPGTSRLKSNRPDPGSP